MWKHKTENLKPNKQMPVASVKEHRKHFDLKNL